MSKISLGSKFIGKPNIEELAANATITNSKVVNIKCYLFTDRRTWKKIKRKWIDNTGKILDLTNEDYHEFDIVEESQLRNLEEDTKIYDIVKEELRPID